MIGAVLAWGLFALSTALALTVLGYLMGWGKHE